MTTTTNAAAATDESFVAPVFLTLMLFVCALHDNVERVVGEWEV